jgi:hypothetical protein
MKHINNFDTYNEGLLDEFNKENEKETKEDRIKRQKKYNEHKRSVRKQLKKADDQIRKELGSKLNKNYLFQYGVYVWKSNNENYEEIDVADFKFVDIQIEPRYNWDNDNVEEVFFSLFFTDRDGENISVYFDKTSPTQNKIDLEYAKPWEKKHESCLKASYTKDADKHTDEMEFDNPKSYPRKSEWFDIVPNDYAATQLLSTIKGVLEQINDSIN